MNSIRLMVIGGLAAAMASCGQVVRQDRSAALLTVSQVLGAPGSGATVFTTPLDSAVVTTVLTPPPCDKDNPCLVTISDTGQATLTSSMKNVTVAPTTNNTITINQVHVQYRRADGRNTPGVDVPYPFDQALTVSVPGNSSATTTFELVRAGAKLESPIVQLRANGTTIISTIADVTFYGRDTVGNNVVATGSITVNFGNFLQ